jgi:hypothetical protein
MRALSITGKNIHSLSSYIQMIQHVACPVVSLIYDPESSHALSVFFGTFANSSFTWIVRDLQMSMHEATVWPSYYLQQSLSRSYGADYTDFGVL